MNPLIKDADDIVKILVRSSGQVLFDGELINMQQIETSAKNKVQEFQRLNPGLDKDGKPKQPIFVVKTDEKAHYYIFLDVVDQLKMAQCRKISVVES